MGDFQGARPIEGHMAAVGVSSRISAVVGTTAAILTRPAGMRYLVASIEGGTFRIRPGDYRPQITAVVDRKFNRFNVLVGTDYIGRANNQFLDGDGPYRLINNGAALGGNPNLTFDLAAGNDTIIMAFTVGHNFIEDGFGVGDVITIAGSASNDGTQTIAAITTTSNFADTLEFTGDVLVDEGPSNNITITAPGSLPGGLDGVTDYYIRKNPADATQYGFALSPTGDRVDITGTGTGGVTFFTEIATGAAGATSEDGQESLPILEEGGETGMGTFIMTAPDRLTVVGSGAGAVLTYYWLP